MRFEIGLGHESGERREERVEVLLGVDLGQDSFHGDTGCRQGVLGLGKRHGRSRFGRAEHHRAHRRVDVVFKSLFGQARQGARVAVDFSLHGLLTPIIRPVPSGHNAHMSPDRFLLLGGSQDPCNPSGKRMRRGWLRKA